MRKRLLLAVFLFEFAAAAQDPAAGRAIDTRPVERGTLRWHAQQARERGKTKVTVTAPVGLYASVHTLDEALSIYTAVVVEPIASQVVAADATHIATWHKLKILERLNTHPLPEGDAEEVPAELQPVGSDEVVVRAPGGTLTIDGVEVTSEDKEFPALVTGKKYVVFLRPDASGKYALLQLGAPGVYTMADSKLEPLTERPNLLGEDIHLVTGGSLEFLRAVGARRAAH
jgi:hypothetical protein